MRTVLITGGAGFIGSNLADLLLHNHWNVISIDNFDPYYDAAMKRRNIEKALGNKNYNFYEADIHDVDRLIGCIQQPVDAIVHLAAKAGVRYSISNPVGYEEANVQGTIKVCQLAQLLKIPQIIFASSSSVYGTNSSSPWNEDLTPASPVSPYAQTKFISEQYGQLICKETGISFIVLRFFSVYGPRMRPDLMIYNIAQKIINNEEILIYGDGSSSRDYTYIEDVISGIDSALQYNRNPFDIFNIGNNNPVSLNQLIGIFEKNMGRKAKIKHAPFFAGESAKTCASLEKSQRLLGYSPVYDIETGIELYLKSL